MATKKRSEAATPRSPVAVRIRERWGTSGSEVPLDRIESELDGVARYDVVAALKELEKAGRGQFVVGRKGKKSRFIWHVQAGLPRAASASVSARVPVTKRTAPKRAAARDSSVERERELTATSGTGSVPERSSRPHTLEHAFHVRAGVLVKLQLPADITAQEVERLCQFLQAIPFR
jgi:hypothetical protein